MFYRAQTSMKIRQTLGLFLNLPFHTSFQDLLRSAFINFAYVYRFKVMKSILIVQNLTNKAQICHTYSQKSSRQIGGCLVPKCLEFHLNWPRMDSFPLKKLNQIPGPRGSALQTICKLPPPLVKAIVNENFIFSTFLKIQLLIVRKSPDKTYW